MKQQGQIRKTQIFFTLLFLIGINLSCSSNVKENKTTSSFYQANDSYFQYTGRIDFSNPILPRFWSPGVYVNARFQGDNCQVVINNEMLWNKHNYIAIAIDDLTVQRIELSKKTDTLDCGQNLDKGEHTITICKDTESGIGYIEFVGMKCQKLLEPEAKPIRKIEFYGNSITCGTGSDTSAVPCGTGEWHDQHNAYMSYGPVTARLLKAQWVITAVSGIGMVHSCCDMDIVMPDVYDKINLRTNEIIWDFSQYQPDVVTIALGQNDGIQDSALFCSHYVDFIESLREKYANTTIICLSSPMATEPLAPILKKNITAIVNTLNNTGDHNVYSYFFSKNYNNGCDQHPNLEEHSQIAAELAHRIKQIKNW